MSKPPSKPAEDLNGAKHNSRVKKAGKKPAKAIKTVAEMVGKLDEDTANRGGRPSSYLPAFAKVARQMCEMGATDLDLARALGVTTMTIWRWQSMHPDFCQAMKAGKDVADSRVERSLYQRAVGYSFDTEKLFCFEGVVTRADTVEHVPPDVSAQKHWLNNRRAADWRDKALVEHTGDAIVRFLELATSEKGKSLGPKNPHAEADVETNQPTPTKGKHGDDNKID